jgi:hypothetical protein
MTDDAGNLSIDFLAGFTIFMVTFIYVATLIPGLFIGLQSRSIDYDAVAYRTGVVLVEDPGMPYNPSWETYSDAYKDKVLRFGLALSKDTPNILSPEKISRFFCSTDFVYPDDYRSRAVFGDYPYQFNISFQRADENVTQSVGDVLPEDYGYSRRVVKVKEHSNATLDFSNFNGAGPLAKYTQDRNQTHNATSQVFSVYFNYTYLLENGPANNNPAYQINPLAPSGAGEIIGGEGALINLTGLKKLPTNGSIVNLSSISIYRSLSLAPLGTGQSTFNGPVLIPTTDTSPFELYIDGNITPVKTLPAGVADNLSLYIPPGVLSFVGTDSSALVNITMQFNLTDASGNPQPDRYLNSTLVLPDGAFDYTYSNPNITQPSLHDGVVEVAVW